MFGCQKADGTGYALGDPQPIAGWRLNQNLAFSGAAPENKTSWILSARLLADTDVHLIRPTGSTLGSIDSDGSWTVATANEPRLFTDIKENRFRPISSYGDITTYENLTALRRYFCVSNILWVKNSQEALDLLKTSGNKLRHAAIMEDGQKEQFYEFLRKIQSPAVFDTSGSITKEDVTNKIGYFTTSSALSLGMETKNPALLVVSDLYYPGWKAFLDGKEWPIFRTDCLFRAVLIPAGKHQVLFEYQPLSFAIGAILFVITLVALSLFWLTQLLREPFPGDIQTT